MPETSEKGKSRRGKKSSYIINLSDKQEKQTNKHAIKQTTNQSIKQTNKQTNESLCFRIQGGGGVSIAKRVKSILVN